MYFVSSENKGKNVKTGAKILENSAAKFSPLPRKGLLAGACVWEICTSDAQASTGCIYFLFFRTNSIDIFHHTEIDKTNTGSNFRT